MRYRNLGHVPQWLHIYADGFLYASNAQQQTTQHSWIALIDGLLDSIICTPVEMQIHNLIQDQ